MTKKDGRELARANETRVLKLLLKFAWLRTREVAALLWMQTRARRTQEFIIEPITVESSALRMAQRTLARLRKAQQVLWAQAPDGSVIYGLAEAGARRLIALGVPAKSGKDHIRRVSLSRYHHRRLANEIAILGMLQGYRVVTEAEIAAGQWFAGAEGILGKRPDVVVRDGKEVWLVEVERSRRNARDYANLLSWLVHLWPDGQHKEENPGLPNGYRLKRVVFVCETAFIHRLSADLRKHGWTDEHIAKRLYPLALLYVTEATMLRRVPKQKAGAAGNPAGLKVGAAVGAILSP